MRCREFSIMVGLTDKYFSDKYIFFRFPFIAKRCKKSSLIIDVQLSYERASEICRESKVRHLKPRAQRGIFECRKWHIMEITTKVATVAKYSLNPLLHNVEKWPNI